ncbi:hypothetical protein [Natrononativus amylolyticus]|uniref:hypothetical protein n=1 Tax=Natrononativus amylolyticus TaxID=2963434 RepID=UPI0020CBE9A7|nr:hypothetical protein [Natrononativus amylolyticus]
MIGEDEWRIELLDFHNPGPAATDDSLIFAQDDEFYVLDAVSGDEIIHEPISEASRLSAFTVYNDELIAVGTGNGADIHRHTLA